MYFYLSSIVLYFVDKLKLHDYKKLDFHIIMTQYNKKYYV